MWSDIDIMGFLLYFKVYFVKLWLSKNFRFCIILKYIPHDGHLKVHSSIKDTMEGYMFICYVSERKIFVSVN